MGHRYRWPWLVCTGAAGRGYGTGVGRSGAVTAAGGVHGFPAALTSFIGRAGPVREIAGLLGQYRLVTVTGPGGSGKTRLAGEVTGQVASRFADGVFLAELAPVQDPMQVPAVVAAALGVREQPGVPAADAVARVLARQQLLLVLDNCEHVIGAVAGLCEHAQTSRRPAWMRLEPAGASAWLAAMDRAAPAVHRSWKSHGGCCQILRSDQPSPAAAGLAEYAAGLSCFTTWTTAGICGPRPGAIRPNHLVPARAWSSQVRLSRPHRHQPGHR